jgi:hypothetical protein
MAGKHVPPKTNMIILLNDEEVIITNPGFHQHATLVIKQSRTFFECGICLI